MQYRRLGRTGLDVGVVGLGAEHLEHAPPETIVSIVHAALDRGVNYIDLFMATPDVRDNFGRALKGGPEEVLVAGHLGAAHQDGQYLKSRDRTVCEAFLHDLLWRLGIDALGVLMLHYVDEEDDYERILAPGGLMDLALRLKEQGKARALGMSSHMAPVALRGVESGLIDVLMFPVNPLFDLLPGRVDLEAMWKDVPYTSLRDGGRPAADRAALYEACVRHGVGVVAMKPYAAGWLFNPDNASGVPLTPIQCLSYALAQPGVCTTVPGCKTAGEMEAALVYLDAGAEARDFSAVGESPLWRLRGRCMYCNHCLPCPAGIDIAAVTRLLDAARRGLTPVLRDEYAALTVKASACTACGLCRERCPFGVDAAGNVRSANEIFRD